MRICLVAIFILMAGCSHETPGDLTMAKITSCPSKPNCVSSTAQDKAHSVAPIAFEGRADVAMARLKVVVASLPRTKLVSETADYLHYEVRTRFMGFVDDVEFGINEDKSVIEVRSASRVGYSDMGVNRKRVEAIRAAYDTTT